VVTDTTCLASADPLRITQEFSSILSQPIIATNVGVKLILHKGLFVRAEDGEDEKAQSTTKDSFITRDVGNVTTESAFAFEFGVRPIEEAKALGIDLELGALPFQLQVRVYSPLHTPSTCLPVAE
jgi:hypothetical protein